MPKLFILAALLLLVGTDVPPSCMVRPYLSGPPSSMGQYQLRVDYPPGCRANLLPVRIRTRNGAILPPIGYFRLSAGWPRELRYYVWPGAHVEQKTNKSWLERPIQNTPRGWY